MKILSQEQITPTLVSFIKDLLFFSFLNIFLIYPTSGKFTPYSSKQTVRTDDKSDTTRQAWKLD